MIEPKLALFQEQEEIFSWYAVIFAQYALGLVPKILDPIDMIFLLGKEV